jgi:catechol 2,3-dioxygenase-like lactoylglutathione lyase family enzyme
LRQHLISNKVYCCANVERAALRHAQGKHCLLRASSPSHLKDKMLIGFDHFVILVRDLNAATQTYHCLGFDVRAGGEHPAFGSHNALVALADGTYLELLAFKDTALAARTFWRDAVARLQVCEGFGGYALQSSDLADDVQQIRARGLAVSDPQPGSRVRPDGQRVAWHTALIGGTPPGVLPFLIQDDTPRALRIEPASAGLGSRVRVKEIVVAVNDLGAAHSAYTALLGAAAPSSTQELCFTMHWGSIVLVRADESVEGVYALAFAVEDLERERREMQARGVSVVDEPDGFLIAPDAACGARVRLRLHHPAQ